MTTKSKSEKQVIRELKARIKRLEALVVKQNKELEVLNEVKAKFEKGLAALNAAILKKKR